MVNTTLCKICGCPTHYLHGRPRKYCGPACAQEAIRRQRRKRYTPVERTEPRGKSQMWYKYARVLKKHGIVWSEE